MNWSKTVGQTEYIFIGCFLLIYVIYLIRTFWVARLLKSSARAVVLKFMVRSLAFAMLIMALLDPSFGETTSEIKAVGRDIMLVVDVSKSMLASDVQPSRLEKTKFELLKIAEHFKNDRLGLVIFASEAFVQSPLTFDNGTFGTFVRSLSTDLVSQSGTVLYKALDIAFQKLVNHGGSNNASKTLVVFSDGEDYGGSNSALLRKMRFSGINCFVVGVGTENGAKIWNGDSYLMNDDGEVVITRLEKETLQQLASATKGRYFEITNRKNEVGDLIKAIETVESALVDQRKVAVAANKYYYFLIGALALLVIDVLITVRVLKL